MFLNLRKSASFLHLKSQAFAEEVDQILFLFYFVLEVYAQVDIHQGCLIVEELVDQTAVTLWFEEDVRNILIDDGLTEIHQ